MKKSKYTISQELEKDIYLLTSFVTRKHILLSHNAYNLYNNEEKCTTLKSTFPKIFDVLVDNGFLVEDDLDEFKVSYDNFNHERGDKSYYHLIINPTLDCNLSCWYCYEHKIKSSRIDSNIIKGINLHIKERFSALSFKGLKLSFFGGEPFMFANAIKEIIYDTYNFCSNNNIELLLDFTTNGTLISKSIINHISKYRCNFQITFDGDREQHNRIKFTNTKKVDTYSLTLNNIKLIQENIPNSLIAIRINYDGQTLNNFDRILSDLKGIDKNRVKIILKKVWQVDKDEISEDLLNTVKAKLWKNGFVVDAYGDPGICFADRDSEAVINYDGNVFKCTTIDKFDKSTALGTLDLKTGQIIWDEKKIRYLRSTTILEECKKCIQFPDCGGPCKIRLAAEPNWKCPNLSPNFDIYAHARSLFKNELIEQGL